MACGVRFLLHYFHLIFVDYFTIASLQHHRGAFVYLVGANSSHGLMPTLMATAGCRGASRGIPPLLLCSCACTRLCCSLPLPLPPPFPRRASTRFAIFAGCRCRCRRSFVCRLATAGFTATSSRKICSSTEKGSSSSRTSAWQERSASPLEGAYGEEKPMANADSLDVAHVVVEGQKMHVGG